MESRGLRQTARTSGRFLRLAERDYGRLRDYLLRPCGREHKLYAWLGRTPGGLTLWRLRLPEDPDYAIREAGLVCLTPECVVREMTEFDFAMADGFLDAHSHPFQEQARFSSIDDDYAPRTARAVNRKNPAAAFVRLVVGQREEGFELQSWSVAAKAWEPIEELHVVGPSGVRRIRSHLAGRPRRATTTPSTAFSRNELLRSPVENERIRGARIAIVGAGGLGWALARGTAALGIDDVTLIDGDRVELCNLNRLVEATPEDAAEGRRKVEVLAELLRRHTPGRSVRAIPEFFPSPDAVEAVATADLVLVGVDSLRCRFDVLRVCARHLVPAIDCGTSIRLDSSGEREHVRDGHVWMYVPGKACWSQMGLEGAELWSPTLREARERAGYVIERPGVSPGSVQMLNETVTSMAMGLAEAWLLGRAPELNLLLYRQRSQPRYDASLKALSVAADPACPLCGDEGAAGMGGDPFANRCVDPVEPHVERLLLPAAAAS